MAEIQTFERVLWGLVVSLNTGLVFLLFFRKNHRLFPFFSIYALLNFLQSMALFEVYRIWGFSSDISSRIAWSTQGLVVIARGIAVGEICHCILAIYRGVWRLAWRLLLGATALVSLYSWAVSRGSWEFAILNFDRGLELAIASVIVVLFLFARYYDVSVEATVRALAIGFFLFSCFRVLNDTILEHWLTHYETLWNFLGTTSFLASLVLWNWGLWRSVSKTTIKPDLLSENLYRLLAPEINARLRTLNEQLSRFWHIEGKKT